MTPTLSPPRRRKCENSGKFWKNQGTSGGPYGIIERLHRTLKIVITSVCSGNNNWTKRLPLILQGLQSRPQPDCSLSPTRSLLRQRTSYSPFWAGTLQRTEWHSIASAPPLSKQPPNPASQQLTYCLKTNSHHSLLADLAKARGGAIRVNFGWTLTET